MKALKQFIVSVLYCLLIRFTYSVECVEGLLHVNGASSTCELPESTLIEESVKCLSYCKNNGICSIVNQRPVCSCVDNHYGITCSFTKENVVDSMNTYLTEIENNFSALTSSNEKETIINLRALSMLSLQKVSYFVEIVSSSTHETFINDICKHYIYFYFRFKN